MALGTRPPPPSWWRSLPCCCSSPRRVLVPRDDAPGRGSARPRDRPVVRRARLGARTRHVSATDRAEITGCWHGRPQVSPRLSATELAERWCAARRSRSSATAWASAGPRRTPSWSRPAPPPPRTPRAARSSSSRPATSPRRTCSRSEQRCRRPRGSRRNARSSRRPPAASRRSCCCATRSWESRCRTVSSSATPRRARRPATTSARSADRPRPSRTTPSAPPCSVPSGPASSTRRTGAAPPPCR